MKIPVFVSAPSHNNLSAKQRRNYAAIVDMLDRLRLETRALGRSDFPKDFPLREVYQIARRCSGGIILGFTQDVGKVMEKPWNKPKTEAPIDKSYPTPWNNLEAGILYSLKLPLMILREPHINGGVFDRGVTDVFVHTIPDRNFSAQQLDELYEAMLKWHSQVQKHYYDL